MAAADVTRAWRLRRGARGLLSGRARPRGSASPGRDLPCQLHPPARDGDFLDRVRSHLAQNERQAGRPIPILDRRRDCPGGAITGAALGRPERKRVRVARRDCSSSAQRPVWIGKASAGLAGPRPGSAQLRRALGGDRDCPAPRHAPTLARSCVSDRGWRRPARNHQPAARRARRALAAVNRPAHRRRRGGDWLLRPEPSQSDVAPCDRPDTGPGSRGARAASRFAAGLTGGVRRAPARALRPGPPARRLGRRDSARQTPSSRYSTGPRSRTSAARCDSRCNKHAPTHRA